MITLISILLFSFGSAAKSGSATCRTEWTQLQKKTLKKSFKLNNGKSGKLRLTDEISTSIQMEKNESFQFEYLDQGKKSKATFIKYSIFCNSGLSCHGKRTSQFAGKKTTTELQFSPTGARTTGSIGNRDVVHVTTGSEFGISFITYKDKKNKEYGLQVFCGT